MDPMNQSAQIRSYFDSVAFEYQLERERQYSFVSQRDLVLQLLPEACSRILDIGCGPAVMEAELLKRSKEVWGIDASGQMVQYGKARMNKHPAGERCHLAIGDIERLEFASGSFDAVVSMGVIEYLLTYDRALGEIYRVLHPGGVAVITVPNRVCEYHLARESVEALRKVARRVLKRPPGRTEGFVTNRCVPWRLDRQLERAGFHRVEGRFCNFILYPLHELQGAASLALNKRMGVLAASKLGVWLGTQYVVKAQKR